MPAIQAREVDTMHGGALYGSRNKRTQAQTDSMLQVPLNPSASYRWLEDAITEWQVSREVRNNRGRTYFAGELALSMLHH